MQEMPEQQAYGRWFSVIAWVLIMLVLFWFAQKHLARRENPNMQVQGSVQTDGSRQVQLRANPSGHFVGTIELNQQPVQFMLDTGATAIAVPEDLAAQLGMKKGMVMTIDTANGSSRGYSSHIEQLKLGPIELQNVRAIITTGMEGDEILLGMSALNQLEFSKRDNTLTLIQHLN